MALFRIVRREVTEATYEILADSPADAEEKLGTGMYHPKQSEVVDNDAILLCRDITPPPTQRLPKDQEFAKPKGLSDAGETAYSVIEWWRTKKGLNQSGGCKTYYSPAEWKARREAYGTDSELVVVHDGGDLSDYGNDPLSEDQELNEALRACGLYLESCTCWHHAVYKI